MGIVVVFLVSIGNIGLAVFWRSRLPSERVYLLISGAAGLSYLYVVYTEWSTSAVYLSMTLFSAIILCVLHLGYRRYLNYAKGY
ncbi:hypothetical protein [Haloprofundus salinisoli]|uniref:hypothetical protein n=1 Tax=Haloprofundus salinisoli TaxID=2876193 RepID=UPI001CCC0F8A|nr:hypothetical protein [Haloprofundus salinisoli]